MLSSNRGDEAQQNKEISPLVQGLLERYPKVFEAIKGLPPTKDIDHAICLEPGANPVNVRPYRCPHFQKNKIERLV